MPPAEPFAAALQPGQVLTVISTDALRALAADIAEIAKRTDERRPPRARDGERLRDAQTAVLAYLARLQRDAA